MPKIPGADGANVIIATDAIMNSEKIGRNVVIIGGGEVGVETGMFLAQQGREVTVVEMRDELAADTTFMHYRSMFQAAWEGHPQLPLCVERHRQRRSLPITSPTPMLMVSMSWPPTPWC